MRVSPRRPTVVDPDPAEEGIPGLQDALVALHPESRIVDDTIKRLESADRAAEMVKLIIDQVPKIIKTYSV
jgi:hypothetical protein